MASVFLAIIGDVSHGQQNAHGVSVNLHQAFPVWVEGERWIAFVNVQNQSSEVIALSGVSDEFRAEQIRVIPIFKDGFEPHNHGGHSHSHKMPHANTPWEAAADWSDHLRLMNNAFSLALKPGQSEVIGDLGLRNIWHASEMPNPHIDSFKIALRIGPERYIKSDTYQLSFADTLPVAKQPIFTEVERSGGSMVPIRKIEINEENWLYARNTRIARVPDGAVPKFSTENDKRVLVINFEGSDEEPVRYDIPQGFPLSGSKFTVPHLHLWRGLTDRSMFNVAGTKNGFFEDAGLTLEQALKLKWDGTDPELGGSPRQVEPPRDGISEPAALTKDGDAKSQASSGSDARGVGFWLMIAALVGVGVVAFVLIRRRR